MPLSFEQALALGRGALGRALPNGHKPRAPRLGRRDSDEDDWC